MMIFLYNEATLLLAVAGGEFLAVLPFAEAAAAPLRHVDNINIAPM